MFNVSHKRVAHPKRVIYLPQRTTSAQQAVSERSLTASQTSKEHGDLCCKVLSIYSSKQTNYNVLHKRVGHPSELGYIYLQLELDPIGQFELILSQGNPE